jgi:hypothetical protein
MDNLAVPENLNMHFWRNSRGHMDGLQPQIVDKLPVIAVIFRDVTGNQNYGITITAGQEWHNGHGLMSLHHTGFAVDIRTRDLPGGPLGPIALQILSRVQAALGSDYWETLHEGTSSPHLHVQYSPGMRMSNPGDFPASDRV